MRQFGEKETYVKPPATSVLAIVALFESDSNQSRITRDFYVVFEQNTRSNRGNDKSKIELILASKCPSQQRGKKYLTICNYYGRPYTRTRPNQKLRFGECIRKARKH